MTTKLFGEPVRRREDARLIVGKGRYLDDIGHNALAAAFVRSPHAHARITDIDVTDALEVDGLVAVYTYDDLVADGASVTTVEGLARDDKRGGQILHPVQEAFRECHALQCGFCTPGFLTTIAAGLEKRDNAAELTEGEVDDMVGGNLCRCTGYANIKKAVHHANAAMRDAQ